MAPLSYCGSTHRPEITTSVLSVPHDAVKICTLQQYLHGRDASAVLLVPRHGIRGSLEVTAYRGTFIL